MPDEDRRSWESFIGEVVEVDCLKDGCDGNFAWLIGRTKERCCRKCRTLFSWSDEPVFDAIIRAAQKKRPLEDLEDAE